MYITTIMVVLLQYLIWHIVSIRIAGAGNFKSSVMERTRIIIPVRHRIRELSG